MRTPELSRTPMRESGGPGFADTRSGSGVDVLARGYSEQTLYHRAVADSYRIVDGSQRMDPAAALATKAEVRTDAQVFQRLKVMAPRHRIVFAQFRMLVLLAKNRGVHVLALLVEGRGAARSWYGMIVADLAWVASAVPKLDDLQFSHARQWMAHLEKYHKQTLAVIKE